MEEKELNMEEQLENSENESQLSEDELGYKEFVDSLEEKWYVLHTFSGYENVAKENLETVIEKFNLQDRISMLLSLWKTLSKKKMAKRNLFNAKLCHATFL